MRVAATAAKRLCGVAVGKALRNGRSTRGGKDLVERGVKDVAKGDHAVAIHAARDDRAVGEDAEMVAKPIAKDLVARHRGISVGPNKAISPFQMELISDAKPARVFRPLALKAIAEEG